VTVTCPELLVVPLVADKLPAVALQVMVFPASELLSTSFSVAVRVREFSDISSKLDESIVSEVDVFSGGGDGTDTVSDRLSDQFSLPAPSIARTCHVYAPLLRASPDVSV